MSSIILSEIKELLSNSLAGKINDFNIEVLGNIEIEQGLMKDIYSILLTHYKSREKIYIVLKQQAMVEGKVVDFYMNHYENETHFYRNIWKKFSQIYKDKTGKNLDIVPNCLGVSQSSVNGTWRIAMENLSSKGFRMLNRTVCFNDEHFKILFRAFGKFHSLSMALKEENDLEYRNLLKPLKPTVENIIRGNEVFGKTIKGILRRARNYFDPISEGHLIEKIASFEEEGPEFCYRILTEDKYDGVILHGDCWSNNFMFKYDVNHKVDKVTFVDFQYVHSGSPILDLSHCLYAGGTEESFKKFESYLLIYHDSLSETLKEFNLNIDKIYPLQRLTDEWKKYCKFGLAMAIVVWMFKFIHKDVVVNLTPNHEDMEFVEPVRIRESKENEYKQRIRELIYHMYENNFF